MLILTALLGGLGAQRATADGQQTWKLDPVEVGARGPKVEAMVEVRTWKTLTRESEKEPRNVDGWVLKEPWDVTGWVVAVDPVERWRPLVCAYADWDCEKALRVLRCESTGSPVAYNSGNVGLMQINTVHSHLVGGDPSRLYEPSTNIAVGHLLYQAQGWQPWPYCGRL